MVLKSKLAILTLVVLFALCLSNVEGGCSYVYIRRCYLYRTWSGQLRIRCYFVWFRRCYGKRTIAKDYKDVAPFPERFDVYDTNKDGQITLKELAKATNTKEHSKATKAAFQKANTNGGNGIDCNEFKAAPFLFNHDPTCG